MRGTFPEFNSKIDYRKQKAGVSIRPAKGLNKETCRDLRFHKSRNTKNKYFLSYLTDYTSGKTGKSLTSGASVEIFGKSLKIYRYQASSRLTLTPKSGVSGKRIEVPLKIVKIRNGSVSAVVPGGLRAGIYNLDYFSEYGSVRRIYPNLEVEVWGGVGIRGLQA